MRYKSDGRPTPKSVTFDGKRQCRISEWYARYSWICCSEIRKSFFCFPCVIFQFKKSRWSDTTGIKDIGNLTNLARLHVKSPGHISAIAALSLLGKWINHTFLF